jgi:hypothetical protein
MFVKEIALKIAGKFAVRLYSHFQTHFGQFFPSDQNMEDITALGSGRDTPYVTLR